MDDFKKFATRHLGINSMVLDDVVKAQNQYLNPYILEERQLNVTQMDLFSRLMMDRIIFLGTAIDDYTANTLQAQLLYLDSCDPGKDISIYVLELNQVPREQLLQFSKMRLIVMARNDKMILIRISRIAARGNFQTGIAPLADNRQ